MTNPPNFAFSLLCRLGSRYGAFPIESVVEIMRPLPVEPISGAPEFVQGLSIIRGAPVPVVDSGLLFCGKKTPVTRFVTLRAGGGIVALAVEDVTGIQSLDAVTLQALPPLLREAGAEAVSAIGALDTELLMVFQSARVAPEQMFTQLLPQGAET